MHKLPVFLFFAISFSCLASGQINAKFDTAAKPHEFYSYTFPSNNIECTDLDVSGYMLGHAHGLPTNPIVSNYASGLCIIDGVLFNMPGDWRMNLELEDEVVSTFRFIVE